METVWKLLAGGLLGSPLVAYLTFRFQKAHSKEEYRKSRIAQWNLMINQVHDNYPTSHFKNWDQFPSLEKFLTEDELDIVLALKLGEFQSARQSNRSLGGQDKEFMNVVRMLKTVVARVEKEEWKLL